MTTPKALSRAWRPLIACVVCILGMSGCVNLNDVTQLSTLADSAQQSLPAVVAGIAASCARQNVMLEDIPSAERPASLTAQDCAPYQDVAGHLAKDQGVLIAYFDALGELASNAPPSYDQTIDTNVTAIGGLPNLSKEAVTASTAAQKVMKFLADQATAGYRKRKVTSLIVQADPAVQELTSDLKKAIVTDYAGILSNENSVLDIYYKSPIAAAAPTERLSRVLAQRQYEGDQAALRSRIAATVSYGKVMDGLASLHAKLVDEAKKKASLKDTAKDIGPDIANLKAAIAQLQTEIK
jgi:hypothetical protein